MRRALAALLLSVAGTATAAPAAPDGDARLIGDWVLCEDPDGSPSDQLRFGDDGSGKVIRDQSEVAFVYTLSDGKVSVLVQTGGRLVPITLTPSFAPQDERLSLYDERTGNTAYYVRAERAATAGCSVK